MSSAVSAMWGQLVPDYIAKIRPLNSLAVGLHERHLIDIVKICVPTFDPDLVVYLAEQRENRSLLDYIVTVGEARQTADYADKQVAMTLDEFNVRNIGGLFARAIHLEKLETAYSKKPYDYLEGLQETYESLLPIFTFNTYNPDSPITLKSLKDQYTPQRTVFEGPKDQFTYEMACLALSEVKKADPDWEASLASYEKGLRIFQKMEQGKARLQRKAAYVTQACAFALAHKRVAEEQREVSSNGTVMKAIWQAVVQEMSDPAAFDKLTNGWPAPEVRRARHHIEKIHFYMDQMGLRPAASIFLQERASRQPLHGGHRISDQSTP